MSMNETTRKESSALGLLRSVQDRLSHMPQTQEMVNAIDLLSGAIGAIESVHAFNRDYFAGQALAGLVGDYDYGGDYRSAAIDAYAYADAMLAEREKSNEPQ